MSSRIFRALKISGAEICLPGLDNFHFQATFPPSKYKILVHEEGEAIMRRFIAMCLVAGIFVAAALTASAEAKVKKYQVTGPVVEVTDTKIVIQTKDDGNWEITRDATTKITGELKVGAKVTVEYRMTAIAVEAKAEKAEKADAKAAGK
jgi:hypothetical protein